MKNLLLTVLICFSFGALAQNWAPVGAEWYSARHFYTDPPSQSFKKVVVEKDTILVGQLCSKLIGLFNCPWGAAPKFTYESNDTVYFYHEETQRFLMLFDLGASPGDTWNINYVNSSISTDTIKILVDSIGQTVIDGQTLRVVHITQTNELEVNVEYFGPIIERIGAPKMFANYFNCDPFDDPVRCYSDNLINYQADSSVACDYSTVGLNDEELSSLNIYRNPVSNTLNITIDNGSNLNFMIYNLSSKKVLEGKLLNSQIDVSILQNGTYMLKLDNKNEGFRMSKFVKS